MPINTAFPAYRAEVVPRPIRDLGERLCADLGLPDDAFGAKGGTTHYAGPHRSPRWLRTSPQSRNGADDWSLRGALNTPRDDNEVSAFDLTPGSWGTAENRRRMVAMTSNMLAAARRHDPRLLPMRRFAGTLDGRTVVTFECQGGALIDPYDSSHLDHGHGEVWRSRTHMSLLGVAEIITGGDMSAQAENILVALAAGLDNYVAADGRTVAMVPTVETKRNIEFRATVLAKLAADETRDKATQAMLVALTEMIKSGGGNVDLVVLQRIIETEANKTREAVLSELDERDQRLAAALTAGGHDDPDTAATPD